MTSKLRLEATLWDIANTLRGKMSADDFRDYILGFIFFKYLSEKMEIYADEILHPDGITYDQITAKTKDRKAYLKNAYRVLLTRARQGMVIVVPRGDANDPTRSPEKYDQTFGYLQEIGVPVLP